MRRNGRLDQPRLGIALFKLGIIETYAIAFSPNYDCKLNGLCLFQLETGLL